MNIIIYKNLFIELNKIIFRKIFFNINIIKMSLSNYHKNVILRWIKDNDTENKYRDASKVVELTSDEKIVTYKNIQVSSHRKNVSKYYYQLQNDKWFDENKLNKFFKLSDEVLNMLYDYCNNRIIIFEVLLTRLISYYSIHFKIDNVKEKQYVHETCLGFEVYIYFRKDDYMLCFERRERNSKTITCIINRLNY